MPEEYEIPPARRNKRAYGILFELENLLRVFIRQILEEKFQEEGGWMKRIPKHVVKKCDRRASKEKEGYQELGSDFLMDYADFSDLKGIILQKENWANAFREYFGNEAEIVAKLEELGPIRNTVAHNRIISQKELRRLEIFSDDIKTCIRRITSTT